MARSVARRSELEDPSLSIRRSHTKSKRGCIICKQRKVKCDETRPRCRRCEYGDRPCSYQRDIREGEATSSKRAITPASTSPASPTITTATATLVASSTAESAASGPSCGANLVVTSPTEHAATFDLIHMRLLHHAHDHLAELFGIQGDTKAIIDIIMDKADQEPYALDQLLALSALHLSSKHQDMPVYSRQATELQTRALTAFNRARCGISDTNYLTAFLFTSMLAIHVFYDSLACLEDNLSTFIEKFVEYMRLHRGVRTVTRSHWKQILGSHLQPLLYVSEVALEVEKLPSGEETAPLANFLKSGSSPPSTSTDACVEALNRVQWMLDIIKLDPSRRDIAIQAIVAWPVVISDEYIEAVYQHRPEAFAVLAYYAAALHRCRDFWIFKSAGLGVVEMIARHIGPFWIEALRWPREVSLPWRYQEATCGAYALSIWTHHLQEIRFNSRWIRPAFNYTENVGITQTGNTWSRLLKAASDVNRTVVSDQSGTVDLGGSIGGGGHVPLSSSYGLSADQVMHTTTMTPDGSILIANDEQNQDLL